MKSIGLTTIIGLLCGLLISGTAHAGSTDAGYLVGVDDVLTISVWDNKDLDQEVTVRPDGMISLPLLGEVQVSGLKVTELAARLTELYSQTVRGAQVTVGVREIRSRTIFFVGQVGKPGPLQMTKDLTLLQALALVGGALPDGAHESAFVLREETAIPVDLVKLVERRDLTQNVRLQPGDTIVVPPASTVYVQGEAVKPGEVKYTPGLTILQAIVKAGGFTPQAAGRRVNLIRRDGDRKENVRVDVESIMEDPGEADDIRLQPNDVIVIPQRQRFESRRTGTPALGFSRPARRAAHAG